MCPEEGLKEATTPCSAGYYCPVGIAKYLVAIVVSFKNVTSFQRRDNFKFLD